MRTSYVDRQTYTYAVFLLENRSRGGGIVARRGKGGSINSFAYIILLGYHSRGGGGGGGGQ